MADERVARILLFMPRDRDKENQRIDEEIMDQERSEEVAAMAYRVIDDLDFTRFMNGEIGESHD